VYVFEKYLELGKMSPMSENSCSECVRYISDMLISSRREIDMEIRLNQFMFKGKYHFTKVHYGLPIENENQLRQLMISGSIRKKTLRRSHPGNDSDLVQNIANLNLRD